MSRCIHGPMDDATGHPRGSLTSDFGLHSWPASLRYGSDLQRPAAAPVPAEVADPFQGGREAGVLEKAARHPAGAAHRQYGEEHTCRSGTT